MGLLKNIGTLGETRKWCYSLACREKTPDRVRTTTGDIFQQSPYGYSYETKSITRNKGIAHTGSDPKTRPGIGYRDRSRLSKQRSCGPLRVEGERCVFCRYHPHDENP